MTNRQKNRDFAYDPDFEREDRPADANLEGGIRPGGIRPRDRDRTYGRDYGYDRGMYRGNAHRYNPPLQGREYARPGDWYDYDYNYNLNPGPYQGVGPTSYQRADESIREDINERLTRHGRINARDIHVGVENGEVTLTGSVNTRSEKRMAQDLADSVSGVRDVRNQLKIM